MEITSTTIIRKICLLHVPILFCLFILTDHETNYSDYENNGEGTHVSKRHLAVFTALSRHPPSMRVYRCIIEFIFLAFCASLSLYVWECIVDKRIIAELMFQHPYTLETKEITNDDNNQFYCDYEWTNSVEKGHDEHENSPDFGMDAEMDTVDNDDAKEQKEKMIPQKNDMHVNKHIPSSTLILNKSLDFLLLFLISLFLFTISSSAGGQYIDQTNKSSNNNDSRLSIFTQISLVAAPIFPLMLFIFFVIQMFLPWNTPRYHFWTCISYTIGAPLYDVSFRDGFIGDIFTSMVRPMQDLAFTLFYLMSGLQGWWVYRNDSVNRTATLEEDIVLQPVEHSWLLHTVILPACMISPLWWRFSQTLRQCYDTKRRWPYLGNAMKYFLAAQVVILGVFFEPNKQSHFPAWLVLYVFATIYQILWDIFMDWELLVWSKDGTLGLRRERLFSRKSFYFGVLILNIILRFGWILNFLPTQYLSQTTGVLEYTFSADFSTFVLPFLASAEIIRRTMWGFVRFELEALKTLRKDSCEIALTDGARNHDTHTGPTMDDDDGIEMKPMSIATTVNNPKNMVSFKSLSNITFRNDLSSATDVQIMWELCAYATIFMCTGIIAGIHRQVL